MIVDSIIILAVDQGMSVAGKEEHVHCESLAQERRVQRRKAKTRLRRKPQQL